MQNCRTCVHLASITEQGRTTYECTAPVVLPQVLKEDWADLYWEVRNPDNVGEDCDCYEEL